MEQVKERKEILGWAVFMGAMFIGMGVGSIFDQTGAGTLIGMGVGYIGELLIEARSKNTETTK